MKEEDDLNKWVDEQIKQIESDERYHYERADFRSNLPLFIIQVAMDERLELLKQFKEKLEEYK